MTPGFDRSSTVRAIVLCLVVWLAVSSCDLGGGDPGSGTSSTAPTPSAAAAASSFRFAVSARRIEATDRAGVGKRDRRRVQAVLDTVRDRVTALYVEGFLDPESWGVGDYDAVFSLFAGGAREAARERAAALTAGPDAGTRFSEIRPAGGRIALRALVDRSGAATVVSSVVRFRARADGDEPTLFRSEATFLFRRTGGGWRIVAFDVVRRDRERAG